MGFGHMGLGLGLGRRRRGDGGGEVLSNALTLNAEPLQLNGETLILGSVE